MLKTLKKGVTSASSSNQAPGFDLESGSESAGHQTFPLYPMYFIHSLESFLRKQESD